MTFIRTANQSHRFLGAKDTPKVWQQAGVCEIVLSFTAAHNGESSTAHNMQEEAAAIKIQVRLHPHVRSSKRSAICSPAEHRMSYLRGLFGLVP